MGFELCPSPLRHCLVLFFSLGPTVTPYKEDEVKRGLGRTPAQEHPWQTMGMGKEHTAALLCSVGFIWAPGKFVELLLLTERVPRAG